MQILQAPLGIQAPFFRSHTPLGDSTGLSMQHHSLGVLQAQRPAWALATAQQFQLGVLASPLQARALPIADFTLNQWDFELTMEPEPFEAESSESALPEAVDRESGLTKAVPPLAPIALAEPLSNIAAQLELSPLPSLTPPKARSSAKTNPSKVEPGKVEPGKAEPGKAEPGKVESAKAQSRKPSVKPSAKLSTKSSTKPKRQSTQAKTQPQSKTARQSKNPPVEVVEASIQTVEAVEAVEAVELPEQQISESLKTTPAELQQERDRSHPFNLSNDLLEIDALNTQVLEPQILEPQIKENEESRDRAILPIAETAETIEMLDLETADAVAQATPTQPSPKPKKQSKKQPKKQQTQSKNSAVQPKRTSTRRTSKQHSQQASNQPSFLETVLTPATAFNPDAMADMEIDEADSSIALPSEIAQNPQIGRSPHLHQADHLPQLISNEISNEERLLNPQQQDHVIDLAVQPEVDRTLPTAIGSTDAQPVESADPSPAATAIETHVMPKAVEIVDTNDTISEPKQRRTSRHRQTTPDSTRELSEVMPQLDLTPEPILPIASEIESASPIVDQTTEALITQQQSEQQFQPIIQLSDVSAKDASVEAVQAAIEPFSGEALITQQQSEQQLQPTVQLSDVSPSDVSPSDVSAKDASVEAVQAAIEPFSGLPDRGSLELELSSAEAITTSTQVNDRDIIFRDQLYQFENTVELPLDEQPIHLHELPINPSSTLPLKPDAALPRTSESPAVAPEATTLEATTLEATTLEATTLEATTPEIDAFFPDDVPIQGFSVGGQAKPVNLPSATPIAPSDTIPALLTPGEFIINARDAQKHLPILRHINQGGEFEPNLTADSATDTDIAETPAVEPISDQRSVTSPSKVSRQLTSVQRAPSETLDSPLASPLVTPQNLSVFRSLQSGAFDSPKTDAIPSTYTSPRRIFRAPAATTPPAIAAAQWSSVEDLLSVSQGEAASGASFPEVALPLQTVIHRQVQGFASGGEVTAPAAMTTATETIERSDDAHTDNEMTTAIETLAQEIYQRLRQRLEIERERQGFYSGRLPW